MRFKEVLPELFAKSKLLILDFSQIPKDAPDIENIQLFFEELENQGLDPTRPQYRQKFNDKLLSHCAKRYLISRYGEDRIAMLRGSEIARQGRTLHLGVDIFSTNLEDVFSPCDGQIIRVGYEKQSHGYGHYIVVQPARKNDLFVFLGHLGQDLPSPGPVRAGDKVGRLGDYINNENGGWSRHLHLQLMTELVPEGDTPIGYTTPQEFGLNSQKFPDPMKFFPDFLDQERSKK